MDLVEVSPMAKPPVCKIMDYGKFKYLEKKKQNEAKKKQVVVQLKEVKLRPRTEEHDYTTKMKKVREFLAEANKIRIDVEPVTGHEMQKIIQRISGFDRSVVDRALEAADGDLVVAMVDGTLALKRLSRRNGHVRLLPENPCHRPDALADDPELSVWGVATSVVHSLRR